jgi:hypothetical protein
MAEDVNALAASISPVSMQILSFQHNSALVWGLSDAVSGSSRPGLALMCAGRWLPAGHQ